MKNKNVISGVQTKIKIVVNVVNIFLLSLILGTTPVFALESNTSSIDGFITFVCDWLFKIGGVVMMVGAVMFALGWQREDAEGKSRGLMTLMAGGMIMAISASKGLFGL